MKKEQVISLIIAVDPQQRIILLKRLDDVHCGGLWSFPGGKVGDDEMPLQAAVRELKEETKLSGKHWRHLDKMSHEYEDRKLHFLIFICRCHDLEGLKTESEYLWVPLDQLSEYPMPVANRDILEMLYSPEVSDYLAE